MDQQKIIRHLNCIAEVDAELGLALQTYGYLAPRIRPAGFETLLDIIVGQQISTGAARAIMRRLRELLPEMQAQALLNSSFDDLRSAGLSSRKAEYAQGMASAIVDGALDIDALASMEDSAAIQAITGLRGFGEWSAEIYLMFALGRCDIFPANDLALRVALQKIKRLPVRPDVKQSRAMTAHWTPWRSAGSLFLWHFYRGAPA